MMWQFCTPAFDHKVIAVALWLVYTLESFASSPMLFDHSIKFVATNWSGIKPNFIIIIPLRILSQIQKESIALRIEFDHVKLQRFVSVILFRYFIHSCRFLAAGYITYSSTMVFVGSQIFFLTHEL